MKYVATCQVNNCINFWDANNYMHRERINTSDIQLCIKWCGNGVNRLFTGGLDKKIHCFDVEKLKEQDHTQSAMGTNMSFDFQEDKNEIRFHTECINELLPIPEMNLIASASFDTNMILWNMRDMQFKSAHTDH